MTAVYYRYWGKAKSLLETDYCSNRLSVEEIARKHGISEAQLNRLAHKHAWRKTKERGPYVPCHLLPYHCLDVTAAGKILLEQEPSLLSRFEQLTAIPAAKALPWILFMLALHDLGKFAEAFQQLHPELRMQWWGTIKKKIYDVRHDTLGYLLWHDDEEGLDSLYAADGGFIGADDFYDLFEEALKPWLQAVTGHHGLPPRSTDATHRVSSYFREGDAVAAKEFIDAMANLLQPDVDLLMQSSANKRWRRQQKEAAWLLAGFAVLCDWLGSDAAVFRYCDEPMPLSDYWTTYALPRAEQVIDCAGIIPAQVSPRKTIETLFSHITSPTPLQHHCTEVALSDSPQLFILEDVTGAGKTEAALMLAHRLMAKGMANGIFVALPTMATANAMYERMAAVYRALYAEDARPSLILTHSARHLSERFQQSLWQAETMEQPYGKGDQTASAQCTRWLADGRKKALLADVGIGTVDQALLGILPARHQSLRLLGLSSKVLLIDEVHAYDHYMFPLLKTLLRFHAGFGGNAILLSATLPMKQRQELTDAWHDGRHRTTEDLEHAEYPLMTRISDQESVEIPVETRREVARRVDVKLVHSENDVLALVRDAVSQGQCICWIRNTVHDAREAYRQLKTSSWVAPERLSLFHSRFVLADRLAIEQQTLDFFGEHSSSEERHGRILIATQVVEQSLDLDFDQMVSDLAPIDLLIQRAGRLRRHVRLVSGERNRAAGAKDERGAPLLHVFSPLPEEVPSEQWFKALFPKANYVYPHTGMLWLTTRLLARHKGWSMPDDARQMIEGVYGDEAEEVPDALQEASWAALGDWAAQSGLADMNTLDFASGYCLDNAWDDEARIPTRLAEDSVTIFLALVQEETLVPLCSDGPFPWDLSSTNTPRRRISGIPEKSTMRLVIEALKSEEKRFDETSVILPLTPLSDQIWAGEAIDGEGHVVRILYDKEYGLLIADETE